MTKKAITVIGEGITEKFYIESLKNFSDFSITPKELGKKASNLKVLRNIIEGAIKQGFDEVYCLIDMDGKRSGVSKTDYIALKEKYHNKVRIIKKQGITCKVVFLETERCTELWFLFHYLKSAITKEFSSYDDLEKELKKYLPNYSKNEKYFRSIGSIHKELTKKGSLSCAMSNSKSSMISKERDSREYTYSEMHLLIEALKIMING